MVSESDVAQQGSEGVQACSSCHGAQGGGNAAAGWPRLAGLNADYMAQQLKAMANGTRSNPIMAPIASALSEQQRGDVAEYFASLKPPTMAPGGEVDQKTLHRGETLAQRGDWQQGIHACTSCHGLQGQGVGVAFPSIAGQPATYLQNQIKAWQSGSRHNDPNGLMASVAKRLSDKDSQAVTLEPGAEGYHQPPSLDDIPEGPFGDSVRSGWEAFVNTRQHPEARRFVGNKQNCGNCHLAGGLAANSAPMWGAWGIYPKYRGKNDHVNTMDERIRGCFTYSMNANSSEAGGPPEPDSQVLKDLQAFFFWSAEGAPIGKNLPGRGYAAVPEPRNGSSVSRGEEVYQNQCSICHGSDGSGKFADDGRQIFPPLWGAGAYNWGAGMHRINTAAAFINSHERPQDPRWEGSKASTDEKWHTHQCLYNETVRGHTLGDGAG